MPNRKTGIPSDSSLPAAMWATVGWKKRSTVVQFGFCDMSCMKPRALQIVPVRSLGELEDHEWHYGDPDQEQRPHSTLKKIVVSRELFPRVPGNVVSESKLKKHCHDEPATADDQGL